MLLGCYDMRLLCDFPKCPREDFYAGAEFQTEAQAKRAARRDGWRLSRTNHHYCPKHSGKKVTPEIVKELTEDSLTMRKLRGSESDC